MQPERQGRPEANRAAWSVDYDSTILPPTTLLNPKVIAAGYAVLLVRRDQRVTRQVYLSLHSATKAVDRARESGRHAEMVLVELVPVTTAPVYLLGGDER